MKKFKTCLTFQDSHFLYINILIGLGMEVLEGRLMNSVMQFVSELDDKMRNSSHKETEL